MRKIVVAFTAATLALSMIAQAIPAAAAVSGYDSAYAGESAFVALASGQSNDFQVFFANTGTTTWTKGTSTQVDLAACLDDKVTCNAQDATEAPWNPGTWLSATRYATHTQTSVAPGSIGTFKYTVTAPAGAAAGTYRFNGDLVVDATGATIHPEGYYQDATLGVAGSAATLTSVTPNTGSSNGGDTVTLAGTNFQCTPTFPTVNFGANTATVTSCGAGTIVATTPAGAVGTVSVTVTNAGAAASNGIDFTYKDTTRPNFSGISASGNTITTTWSEPVCRTAINFAPSDWAITVNGVADAATSDTAPVVDATPPTVCATTFDITVATPFVTGDQVIVTLTATGAAKIQDVAGNLATTQTRGPVTATGDTSKPQMASAITKSNGTDLKITYTEPVTCAGGAGTAAQFSVTPTGSSTPVTGVGSTCTANPPGSTTVTVTFPASTFASGVGGSVTYTADTVTTANQVSDRVGNFAVTPQTLTYNSFSADTTAPLSQDVRLKTSGGFATLLDTGDVVTVAFNELMAATVSGDKIRVTDADGTIADVTCGPSGNATCSWNATASTIGGVSYPAGQVLTVTLTADPVVLTGFGGTQPGVSIPATVIDSALITDAAGNAWNIPGSPDKTIN